MRIWLLIVLWLLPGLAMANDSVATFTILEGQALVYRGTGRLQAAEGVRLQSGDIVETLPSTFAQLELPDGIVLQLGAGTRLQFVPPAPRQKSDRSLYLLEGWLKQITHKRNNAAGPGLEVRGPSFELPPASGVAVLHATPAELRVFAESGEARVGERQKSGPSTIVALRSGDFYQRKLPARGSVVSSVPAAFIDALPRAFRDALPQRMERFRERTVTPREAPAFAYADVEDWLKAEPPVRRALMQRWRSKAADREFRSALVANLSAHPEWDPILFPEKYRPKEPPPPPAPRPAGDTGVRTNTSP